jgi:hypothetical protein
VSLPYFSIVLRVRNVRKIPYLTKIVKHYRQGGEKELRRERE